MAIISSLGEVFLRSRAWTLPSAALALTSLNECNANVNLDGLGAALAIAALIMLTPVILAAVVLVANVFFAGSGRGSVGWGIAGLGNGAVALVVAVVALSAESKDEDLVLLGVAALLSAVPLCLLGWHNVKRGREREALAKQKATEKPPPEPEPPTFAPPWP